MPARLTLEALLGHFRPGAIIYIPGGVGELGFLRALLAAEPDRLRGVTLISGLIPGINDFDYAGLHSEARLRVFMMSEALRASFDAGRMELIPLCYTDTAAYLQAVEPDVAILHLTPAQDGRCSFGVSADFGPMVAPGAKTRIGVINGLMPRPTHAATLAFDQLDGVLEIEEPIRTFNEADPTSDLCALAAHVAALVPNGAAVQTGIGAAPVAVWRALEHHRDLTLRSGMATDGFLRAYQAGAMADAGHRAGIAVGSAGLLDWIDGQDKLAFDDVSQTHGPGPLATVDNFTAINSAVEIDLFGQANLEWNGDRLISGVGGAPDFIRAARRSRGGRSITALAATARRGSISRIVPRIVAPTVSLTRAEADTVVTEHGVAQIRNLDLDKRAAALIAIADPAHRDQLAESWLRIRHNY